MNAAMTDGQYVGAWLVGSLTAWFVVAAIIAPTVGRMLGRLR